MDSHQDYESFIRKVIIEGDFKEHFIVGVLKPTIYVTYYKGREEGGLYFPHRGFRFISSEIAPIYDSLNLSERIAMGRAMDRMVASGEADELMKLRYL